MIIDWNNLNGDSTAIFASFVANGDMYLHLVAWQMYKLEGKQLQISKFLPSILTDIRSAALKSGPLYLGSVTTAKAPPLSLQHITQEGNSEREGTSAKTSFYSQTVFLGNITTFSRVTGRYLHISSLAFKIKN